ncbi:low molecular weight T-cell antigen [Mycobacterium tuberculosis]|nr:low molecular weight T-cell antigen [Mycobacterium tuberculosis]
MRLSLTALSAGVGAVAMSLTVGAGVASADPVDAVINTTCNYGQVVAALNATDPGAAAQFNASPVAQSYLRNFLAAPPPQRAAMAAQLQAVPGRHSTSALSSRLPAPATTIKPMRAPSRDPASSPGLGQIAPLLNGPHPATRHRRRG